MRWPVRGRVRAELAKTVTVPARTWYAPRDAASEWPHRVEVELELNWSRSALVLIDVWDTHPNASFGQAMELTMPALQSVLEGYRKRGKPVFHDPSGLAMHPCVLAGWSSNDRVIPWDPTGWWYGRA